MPVPPPTPSSDPSAAFSLNLYHAGDWISQQTRYYCLPAAMQVMINIMSDGPHDETRATQDRLHELARSLSSGRQRGKGSEPTGWAEGLNREGFGRYVVVTRPSIEEAVALAARQLRLTNRPVGLLTWRGAHSWVMSGFESVGDPALTDDFTVTGLWIQDVWYPRVSSNWGEAYPPNSLVPIEQLADDFRPYRRPRVSYPELDGQYVMVLPTED
jgi:hypothetical protein